MLLMVAKFKKIKKNIFPFLSRFLPSLGKVGKFRKSAMSIRAKNVLSKKFNLGFKKRRI
jgi:hypothetical protein